MSTDPRRSFAGCRISATCTTPMCVLPRSATPHTPKRTLNKYRCTGSNKIRRGGDAQCYYMGQSTRVNPFTATPRRVARGTDPPKQNVRNRYPTAWPRLWQNSGSRPATPSLLWGVTQIHSVFWLVVGSNVFCLFRLEAILDFAPRIPFGRRRRLPTASLPFVPSSLNLFIRS